MTMPCVIPLAQPSHTRDTAVSTRAAHHPDHGARSTLHATRSITIINPFDYTPVQLYTYTI